MKLSLSLGLLALAACGTEAQAAKHTHNDTFLPENTLHLQEQVESSDMTEATFNTVIDSIVDLYKPIAKVHGYELQVNRLWSNDTVNASAHQEGKVMHLNMYGGLARRKEVTADGFALVLCHEVGHHHAGFPIYPSTWAANEGQSDYFASQACLKKAWKTSTTFFPEEDFTVNIPVSAVKACDKAHADKLDRKVCYRIVSAGESVATLFATLNRSGKVSVDTPDKTVVTKTFDSHPQAQCRIDTYYQGALCTKKFDENVLPKSEAEAYKVSCSVKEGYVVGIRPTCWFKPAL